MERLIRQEQAIAAFIESLRNSTYHCWPGAVATYDSNDQIASVTVMVNDPRRDPETGQSYGEPWPVLPGVPVAWMRAGGYTVSGILNPGDPVILVAFDVDPTAWIAQGPSQQPVNPNDVRRHGGGYWWALPCNFFGPIMDASGAAAGLLIGKDGDPAQIRFSPGSLQLGNAGGDHVALAQKLDSLVNILLATYSPAGPETGFAAFIAALSTWKGSNWTTSPTMGSSLIKAQ